MISRAFPISQKDTAPQAPDLPDLKRQQLVRWLQEGWLLKGVDEEICHRLCEGAQQRDYMEGSALMRQDMPSDEAYLLLSGSAKVVRETKQEPLTLMIAKPGDLLGEMGLVRNRKRSASVIAREDCQVLVITRNAFESLIRGEPEFAFRIMDVLCQRIERGNNARELAQGYGAEARVAAFLGDLWEHFGVRDEGETYIGLRITQVEVAALLGLARENVSKAFAKLRRAGAIATKGRLIKVLDEAELRSWIC
jgi:CRP-like cAMP-binding protein